MKHFYAITTALAIVTVQFTTAQITRVDPAGLANIDDLYSASFGLLFAANQSGTGRELHITSGTPASTSLVKDIDSNTNSNGLITNPSFTEMNGLVYFNARSNINNPELWVTDGTNAGTNLVKEIAPSLNSGSDPFDLLVLNSTLYFSALTGATGRELWKSDGTDIGTELVRDINLNGNSSSPLGLSEFNGNIFFSADDGATGFELWKSDGTTSGTVLVSDIASGTNNSTPQKFTEFNNDLYFRASGELYRSNGTVGNASLVKNINNSGDSNPDHLISFNNKLYFAADDGVHGNELWNSNGATFGTLLFLDANTSGDGNPRDLTIANGLLFFTVSNSNAERNLWVTDGTLAGTAEIALPGVQRLNPRFLTEYNNKIYFYGYDASQSANTRLLYESDGTVAGTQVVSGSPVTTLSTERAMVVHNNELYFTSDAGNNLYKYAEPLLSVNSVQQNMFKFYPNPVENTFRIQTEKEIDELVIVDITGKIVKTFDNNGISYDIEDLTRGTYFIKIVSGQKEITEKLIKQ